MDDRKNSDWETLRKMNGKMARELAILRLEHADMRTKLGEARATLELIASYKGKTLISAAEDSYSVGANRAFEQLAAIAEEALNSAEVI